MQSIFDSHSSEPTHAAVFRVTLRHALILSFVAPIILTSIAITSLEFSIKAPFEIWMAYVATMMLFAVAYSIPIFLIISTGSIILANRVLASASAFQRVFFATIFSPLMAAPILIYAKHRIVSGLPTAGWLRYLIAWNVSTIGLIAIATFILALLVHLEINESASEEGRNESE